MLKSARLMAGLMVLTLIAAACGDDDDDAEPAGTSATADEGGPATTEAPAASETSAATASTTERNGTADTTEATDGAATAGGTAADWDEVLAAADEEGTVVLYTSHLPNQQQGLEQAFEAAYPGIDLQIQRMLAELEATLDAERGTNAAGADVAVNNFPTVPEKYLAEDALLPIDGPESEAWAGNETFVDGRYFTANYNALGIAWNTNEVPDGITTYDDLLAPELAGRVGVPDGSSSPAIIDWWAFLEENYGGEQFLTDLAAQDPVVYETSVPMQQAVIVGEIAVASYATPSILDEQARGAPIDFTLPDPAWTAPFYAFGLGWSQHPNAARVLLDFMMSPEGQEALAVNGASALEGVDGLIPLDQTVPSQVADRPPGFAEEFGARWSQIFGR